MDLWEKKNGQERKGSKGLPGIYPYLPHQYPGFSPSAWGAPNGRPHRHSSSGLFVHFVQPKFPAHTPPWSLLARPHFLQNFIQPPFCGFSPHGAFLARAAGAAATATPGRRQRRLARPLLPHRLRSLEQVQDGCSTGLASRPHAHPAPHRTCTSLACISIRTSSPAACARPSRVRIAHGGVFEGGTESSRVMIFRVLEGNACGVLEGDACGVLEDDAESSRAIRYGVLEGDGCVTEFSRALRCGVLENSR